MVDGRKAEHTLWQWVKDLLCDENHLGQGLRELRDSRENDLETDYERLAVIGELLSQHKRKIERLATAFGDEEDEFIGASLQKEMHTTKRGYDALQIEKNQLEILIAHRQITEDEITQIKELAATIRNRLDQPSFDMQRIVLDLLDVRVQLQESGAARCLRVQCNLSPSPTLKNVAENLQSSPATVCAWWSSTTTM